MYERSVIQQVRKRITESRRFIQVIIGPRQVGKTTLITQLLGKAKAGYIFESADAVSTPGTLWLEQVWESARVKIKYNSLKEFLLVIDEIQKIDNWSEKVKDLWDADTRNKIEIKVILLGSSSLLLQKGLTESLAGRFESIYLGHWSFNEMNEAFGLTPEQFVWFGSYPGTVSLMNEEERWKKYVKDALIETSISKDILMLTRIDKPSLMKRLFELGCLYSGQILSFRKIQGQLQDAGNTTTIAYYLSLLQTAGLLGGIEKYAADIIRKKSSSPKFIVHNTALISAQRDEYFKEILLDPAEWGRMVESAIGAHFVNASLEKGINVYYWRHQNKEVDFVLERRGKTIAIEVKSGASQDNAGLEIFKKQFNPQRVLLVGNKGLSWQDILKIDPVELF